MKPVYFLVMLGGGFFYICLERRKKVTFWYFDISRHSKYVQYCLGGGAFKQKQLADAFAISPILMA